MIIDVFVREGFNEAGKQIISIHRVHENDMSKFVRDIQDSGKYIQNVRLLRPIRVEPREDRVLFGDIASSFLVLGERTDEEQETEQELVPRTK